MRRHILPLLVAGCMAGLFVGATAFAADPPAKKSGKAMMHGARYLIISPHTAEECMDAMDKMSAEGPAALAKFDFGCMSGDHTAYAIVTASSEDAALKMVPEDLRSKAKAIKVMKFTAKDIQMAHEHMMKK